MIWAIEKIGQLNVSNRAQKRKGNSIKIENRGLVLNDTEFRHSFENVSELVERLPRFPISFVSAIFASASVLMLWLARVFSEADQDEKLLLKSKNLLIGEFPYGFSEEPSFIWYLMPILLVTIVVYFITSRKRKKASRDLSHEITKIESPLVMLVNHIGSYRAKSRAALYAGEVVRVTGAQISESYGLLDDEVKQLHIEMSANKSVNRQSGSVKSNIEGDTKELYKKLENSESIPNIVWTCVGDWAEKNSVSGEWNVVTDIGSNYTHLATLNSVDSVLPLSFSVVNTCFESALSVEVVPLKTDIEVIESNEVT